MAKQAFPTSWVGTYSYDLMPGMPWHAPVTFAMQIEIGWFGIFVGMIEDDATGVPERATISGTVRGHRIRFKKQYKSFWTMDHTGTLLVGAGSTPLVVHYEGIVDSHSLRLIGFWKINSPLDAQVSDVDCEHIETTGTWSAERKSR